MHILKRTFLLGILSFAVFFAKSEDYVKWVNPFIGTDYTGNTYPGAQVPFGMVQLSPDNGIPGWDRIAGYFYPDSTIAGFSHTHLSGTGAGDLYDISFLPVTLPYREAEAPLGIHSRFRHEQEQAEAGYYRVYLSDYDVQVELTATPRCGVQRYTFPEDRNAIVLVNLSKAMNWDATTDTYFRVVDSCTIEGYRFSEGWARDQRVYFRSRFSQPFQKVTIDSLEIGPRKVHKPSVISFDFGFLEQPLTVVTALSPTGCEGAARNLQSEAPHNHFMNYREMARQKWNEMLGRIEVKGGSYDERVIFYTALYHALLAPTLFCDVDGGYRGPDGKKHVARGWTNYSTFSLWDTFRAAHPLYTYVAPECVNDMVQSFLAFYDQHGRLPVWNMWGAETDMMIGYHAVPVIVDAYFKGFRGFDAQRALDACIATARDDNYRGIGFYRQNGYVPYDMTDRYNADNWSLSRTLEYAFDDDCIARFAEALGNKEVAKEFKKRSKNYLNVYNPVTTFLQPRDSKGQFQPDFRADAYTQHICESNAWHYFWSVQHDIEGLMATVGKQHFVAKLDSMFSYVPADKAELPIFSTGMIGQYAHGNEPSHHVAYLYNKVGQPHRTQDLVAQIRRDLYRNEPAGLCGNEDCGQMSAWYVFSAMGFYPVHPVGGEYEITSPLFPEVILHLGNGKSFTILAPEVDSKHLYIRRMTLNGRKHTSTQLTHQDIMQGGVLEMDLE